MASLSSGLNPNVVKTALDDVFNANFDIEQHPMYVDAGSESAFKQSTTDKQAEIMEVFKGVGEWESTAEEQPLPEGNPRVGDQITYTVVNYSKSVDVPKRFFDDDQHEVVNMMIADMARKARISQNKNAFGTYRDAFSSTLCADGVALISDSHSNLNGNTVDNKVSGALSVTTLESAIVALAEQKGQDNEITGHVAKTLLVPTALFKEAVEITESELLANTTDNNLNWISAKYGVRVATSPFLGANAGGSDAAWFLLAQNHSIYRWVRQGVITDLVDYKYQRNNNYIYKGEYREVYGAVTYEGIVGSNGS
ncbi:hypothetical protein GF319_15470 [Candidatus Bathyarchaeota archaeon]|nr:hypothetical protein [Candidatus Bathyarchaeota archaeon]